MDPRWQPGSAGHPFRRYVVEFGYWDDDVDPERQSARPGPWRQESVRVVTAGGVYKAVAMATSWFYREYPALRPWQVDVPLIEDEYEPDPSADLLDYFEVK